MSTPDPGLSSLLTGLFGVRLGVVVGRSDEGLHIGVSPIGLHHAEGFTLSIDVGWRSVKGGFTPGSYAGDLLHAMGRADLSKRAAGSTFLQVLTSKGARLKMEINGKRVDPGLPAKWPTAWKTVHLAMSKVPADVDAQSSDGPRIALTEWGIPLTGFVLSLLPLQATDVDQVGEEEGSEFIVQHKTYERSRLNRAACIALNGHRCAVCGFVFEDDYGDLGREFILVHHVVPVSRLGAGYRVDPAKDLVPVCANCHAMMHRQDPPVSVDDLRMILTNRRSNGLALAADRPLGAVERRSGRR